MIVRALKDCKPRVGTNMPKGGFADLPEEIAKKAIADGLVEASSLEEHQAAVEDLESPKKPKPRRSAPKETTTTD